MSQEDKTGDILVTCVIPTYNRAEFLEKAVHSVLEQAHRNLELIVVDDGSTDRTPEILYGIRDPRLTVLTQDNQGVSAARNTGIEHGSGSHVALLDSDDFWLENKLSRQLDDMLSRGFCIHQTDEIWMRGGRRVNPMKKHEKPEGDFFSRAVGMCLVSPSCVMFTRELWLECGPFDAAFPACEDYDLWLRVLARHPVGLLREKLTVKQGGRADQLSASVPNLDYYRVLALEKLLKTADLDEGRRKVALDALRDKARIFVQGCRKRGKESRAVEMEERVGRLLKHLNMRDNP